MFSANALQKTRNLFSIPVADKLFRHFGWSEEKTTYFEELIILFRSWPLCDHRSGKVGK